MIARLWRGLKDLTIAVPFAAVVEHFTPAFHRTVSFFSWHVVLYGGEYVLCTVLAFLIALGAVLTLLVGVATVLGL